VATETPAAATAAPAADEPIQGDHLIYLVQKRLRELGYDPGPVDGQVGPRTTTAIQTYQERGGLAVDGQPSMALLDHLLHAAAPVTQ
jgi:peptidoglycan hydrolase-like protein with peptidoglycan-binding domain